MKIFSGKTAFITGGASGIGFAIAQKCVNENMNIVIADIEETELRKAESKLKSISNNVLSIACDVSNEKSIINAKNSAIKEFGEINILFNNAGVSAGAFLWETTQKDWDWIINVNIYGLINSIRTFVPIMLSQNNECHIVNTASIAGLLTSPGNGPYSMTKSAIISISETLLSELQMMKANIGVTVVCPRFIKTRIFEAARNRPPVLLNDHVSDNYHKQQDAVMAFLKKSVQNGLEPEIIVNQMFEAITSNRLYGLVPKEVSQSIVERSKRIVDEVV